MQYIQIPYTEWINPFSYSNGQFLINTSNYIDNNSFDLLQSVKERISPYIYDSISKVLIKIYY
jgi:hypothetical protein